jgi:hypothetical protein
MSVFGVPFDMECAHIEHIEREPLREHRLPPLCGHGAVHARNGREAAGTAERGRKDAARAGTDV